jgi:exodeoxyribonuclease VII large subunit
MVWGVAALVHAVSDAVSARFGACAVRGEISGFSRAASGHCYLSLKDADGEQALIRCAMFRRAASLLDFSPADGQLVEVRGRLGVYEPRGELQYVIESMQRAGEGALYERFLKLRAKLAAEGLFEADRKRELPAFPRRIGVVTSLGAAALHDVLTALARRVPHIEVVVYPTLVQGAEAPPALVEAIATAGRRDEVDVLIVCRGGGSLEDLWAFNDERVVRAIVASPLPVVCGVGHETDITLADLAADLRAPTPTAAAELVALSRQERLETLAAFAALMGRGMDRVLDQHLQRLDRVSARLSRPSDGLRRQAHRLALLQQRMSAALVRTTSGLQHRQRALAERLPRALAALLASQRQREQAWRNRVEALDPGRVLARGYAWITDEAGQPLTSAARLGVGQHIHAVLADGEASATVDDVVLTPRAERKI